MEVRFLNQLVQQAVRHSHRPFINLIAGANRIQVRSSLWVVKLFHDWRAGGDCASVMKRDGHDPVKPEVQCRHIWLRARSIEWRSAEKTMCSPDIPEAPDELAGVAGGVDLRG